MKSSIRSSEPSQLAPLPHKDSRMVPTRPDCVRHVKPKTLEKPAQGNHSCLDEAPVGISGTTYNYVILHPSHTQEKQSVTLADWFPAIPSVVASLLAIFIVHQLTKSREREKAVFELHSLVSKLCHELAEVAVSAWTERPSASRNRKDAEVLWRIQQLGAALERLRHLSTKTRWQFPWGFPRRTTVAINVGDELIALRRALTSDPFMDRTRSSDRNQGQAVESAKGAFLVALDSQVSQWSK